MTLVGLMHVHKARHIDDSSHQIAVNDTISVNRNETMKIHAVWPAHSHYGLSAFVITDFGHLSVVSLDGYGAARVSQSVLNGAVKHAGQVSHGFPKHTEEIIELRLTDRIRMVVPVVHGKNFGEHGCALESNIKIRITNDNGLNVSMDPSTKPSSKQIYNYSPCIIRNGPDGVTIHAWNKYSEPATYFAPVYDMEHHELRLETKEI